MNECSLEATRFATFFVRSLRRDLKCARSTDRRQGTGTEASNRDWRGLVVWGTKVTTDEDLVTAANRLFIEPSRPGDFALAVRLIATSSPLIFPLVEEGKFSRELYERFTAVTLS